MRHLVIGQRQKAPNFSAFHWSPHGCLITIGQHETSRHLAIGQRQKATNFSAFHWSPHGCLITIGQHFVVHSPKRTKTSLITESVQNRANHQLLQLCTVRTAWSDSDQAVQAVNSCKSRLFYDDLVYKLKKM